MHIGFSESNYPDIHALPLFSEMASEHFQLLMRGAHVQNFPPQIELITEGDPCDVLHIILSGWHCQNKTQLIQRGRLCSVGDEQKEPISLFQNVA